MHFTFRLYTKEAENMTEYFENEASSDSALVADLNWCSVVKPV